MVLISLAVLFGISLILMQAVGEPVWLLGLQAVLEGALVGSIADWFAVRALFNAPLGITFHTRLVPRNRGRLIRAIVDGVQRQALSQAVIRSRVSETKIVPYLVDMAEEYGIERGLDQLWSRYVRLQDFGEKGADALLHRAEEMDLSAFWGRDAARRVSGQLLALASREADSDRFRARIESYLDETVAKKTESAGMLGALFAFFGRASGSIDTKDASHTLSRAIVQYLREAASSESHALRMWLTEELYTAVGRLGGDRIAKQMLAYPRLRTLLEEAAVRAAAEGEAAGRRFFVAEGSRLWRMLRDDRELLIELEAKLRWSIYRFAAARGYLIGEAIEQTLERYSDEEMKSFIEEKVGDDLEWIRLNGAVLGGVLGLLFFLLMASLGITLG